MVNNAEKIVKIQEAFADIGYKPGLLLYRDHAFADVTKPDAPRREVALAGFGQYPPSYRNSCFGLVDSSNGTRTEPKDCIALGAPLVFELSDGKVYEHRLIDTDIVRENRSKRFNDFLD